MDLGSRHLSPVKKTHKKTEHFKQVLETRLIEAQRLLASATEETRASSARQPDSADQALAEYERQTLAHKAAAAQQQIHSLCTGADQARKLR
jgi:RNA polymerase-binding transcription factor DksA